MEELLARPAIAAAAAEAAGGTGRDAAGCLKKVMWLHRSSLNCRRPLLQVLLACQAAKCMHAHRLLKSPPYLQELGVRLVSSLMTLNVLQVDELQQQESQKRQLHALWKAAEQAAERWSQEYIKARFRRMA